MDNSISSEQHPTGLLFYRRHPINLLLPSVISLVMLVGVGLILTMLTNASIFTVTIEWPHLVLLVGLALFFIVSYFMMQWVFWYFDIWIVTSEKLIDSQLISFFLHIRSELPLRQVQDITSNTTGLLANLFKIGDVIIQTASKQGTFRLISIANPQQATKDIGELVKQAASEFIAGGIHEFVYAPHKFLLGEFLVGKSLISREALEKALAEQKVSGERLGKILIQKGLITKQDLLGALSAQYSIPQIDLRYFEIDAQAVYCLTRDIATKHQVIPVFKSPTGVVTIAISVLSEELVREVKDACGMPVVFVLADEEIIVALIQKYYL